MITRSRLGGSLGVGVLGATVLVTPPMNTAVLIAKTSTASESAPTGAPRPARAARCGGRGSPR